MSSRAWIRGRAAWSGLVCLSVTAGGAACAPSHQSTVHTATQPPAPSATHSDAARETGTVAQVGEPPASRPATATSPAAALPAEEHPPAGIPPERAASGWSFAVLSDIHVSPRGKVTPQFRKLVAQVVALNPRLVIIDGDSTNGNQNDGHGIEDVRAWWKALARSLTPLRDARIPIFAVEGNHDSYTPAQRQGYAEAWPDLDKNPAAIALAGRPPQYYSFDVDGVHFSLLHVVDQDIDAPVADWLGQDLASPQARAARLRFAFGHVPLHSVMGHASARFERKLGTELLKGKVSAYIAGHEHLFWDENLKLDGKPLRQITVGTASGSYYFPYNAQTVAKHCRDDRCILPATQQSFLLDAGTRQARDKVTMLWVTINADGFGTRFMALDRAGKLGSLSN